MPLRVCQKAVMLAIGRKTWGVRPDISGAAGCYAALDRLQSSLESEQGQLKANEEAIGPAWHAGGARFGATNRPCA